MFETKIFPFSTPAFRLRAYIQNRCLRRDIIVVSYGACTVIPVFASTVGKPIPVKKILDPTNQDVEAVHQEYIQALIALFEANKEKYGVEKEVKLQIV